MRLPRPKPLPARVSVPALANVALLLTLFFAIAPSLNQSRSGIRVPRAASPVESGLGAACVVMGRAVTPDGAETLTWAFSDGRGPASPLPDLDAVYLEASRVSEREPSRPFLLKADGEVRYGAVDEVLELLQHAGVRSVILWTRAAGDGERP